MCGKRWGLPNLRVSFLCIWSSKGRQEALPGLGRLRVPSYGVRRRVGHLGGGRVPRGGGQSAGDREGGVGQHREL